MSIAPWRSGAAESAHAPAAASPAVNLGALELVGISQIGADVRACIAVRGTGQTQWLRLGASGALRFESYDAARDAVQLSDGAATCWLTLRESTIVAVPIARNDDGTVNWTHLRMTDKERETEAALMVSDILEAGRLARLGRLPATAPKTTTTATN